MTNAEPERSGLVGRVLARLRGEPTAPADRLAGARAHLAAGRPVEAARLLIEMPSDNGEAQVELGRLYEAGRGVLRNIADAAACYERAAEAGNAEGMTRLAVLLIAGRAVEGDLGGIEALHPNGREIARAPQRARELARAAAEAGNVEGMALAGYLHAAGIGGPVDMAAAHDFYRPAAEAGSVEAALGYGTLLAGGHVGPADAAAARPWFEKAATAGNATARTSLAVDLLRGLGGPADPQRAVDLLRAAGESGHGPALRMLGLLRLEGETIARDREEGERLLRGAVACGDLEAMFRLAEQVRVRAPAEARTLARRASDARHVASMRLYSEMLRRGEGGEKDIPAAWRWLEAAAEAGDREAQFTLGVAHATGEEVTFDLELAAAWSRRAAEAGHSAAKVNLGRFMMQGTGTDRDPGRALRWLSSALDDGEIASVVALGELFAFWIDPPDRTRARALFSRAAQLGDKRALDLLQRLDRIETGEPRQRKGRGRKRP